MANKRITDLTADVAPSLTDVIPVDGATTRKVALTDLFGAITKVGTVTAGTWQGTTIAVVYGGTGATTASAARTNLGLAIGSNVQAWNANLDAFATKTPPTGAVVGTTDAQTLTNKTLTSPAVTSPTGIVKGDVGLGNVDNTSDATKNAAVATLTNKTLTAPAINSPTGIVKGDVGLGNVDNTSDTTKWSATATLTNKTFDTAGAGNGFLIAGVSVTANTGTGAIVRAVSPALTGTPTTPTPLTADNSTTIASTAFVKAVVAGATSGVSSLNGQTGPLILYPSPQGRVTLTSGVAVPPADVTGATTIYYTPAAGATVPIFDGTNFVPTNFSELALALTSNSGFTGYQQSGKNFDLFVVNDAGTIRLGTGPAWTSDTARGTGAGTTELQLLNGLWTNKNALTLRFGSATGNTVSVPVNRATWVGSFRATADGQASDTAAKRLLYNSYNQAPRILFVTDPAANWNYSTATWRQANANTANKVEVMLGLDTFVDIIANSQVVNSVSSAGIAATSVGLDTTTTYSGLLARAIVDNVSPRQAYSTYKNFPGIGYHYFAWVEYGFGANTQTWSGTSSGTIPNLVGLSGTVIL